MVGPLSMVVLMVAVTDTRWIPLTGKIPVQQFYTRPDPFGGNVLIEASAELLFNAVC